MNKKKGVIGIEVENYIIQLLKRLIDSLLIFCQDVTV